MTCTLFLFNKILISWIMKSQAMSTFNQNNTLANFRGKTKLYKGWQQNWLASVWSDQSTIVTPALYQHWLLIHI